MRLQPYQYILYSQTILATTMLVCLILEPRYFFSLNQGGVSNFGTDGTTTPLFTVGFGAVAIGSFLAAAALSRRISNVRRIKIGLYTLSILYAFVLISTFPYKSNDAYESIHLFAGFSVSLAMLAAVLLIRFKLSTDIRLNLAFVVYFFGFGIALLTLIGAIDMLFTTQLICGASFGYILQRSIRLISQLQSL